MMHWLHSKADDKENMLYMKHNGHKKRSLSMIKEINEDGNYEIAEYFQRREKLEMWRSRLIKFILLSITVLVFLSFAHLNSSVINEQNILSSAEHQIDSGSIPVAQGARIPEQLEPREGATRQDETWLDWGCGAGRGGRDSMSVICKVTRFVYGMNFAVFFIFVNSIYYSFLLLSSYIQKLLT